MAIESIYRFGLRLRHRAYDKGWLASEKAPICTVSVGNVAFGGSGKTPIVQTLAKAFSPKYKVAISLRGYLGAAEHFDEPILVTGQTDPALCGDEALVHAINLPDVLVWAGKSRIHAGRLAADHGAKVLFLDDGMQHRKLHRDVEIAVVDAQEDLEKQWLRDLPERLRYADAVILHNAQQEWMAAASNVKTFTDAPMIATRMSISEETARALKGKRIAYFCGIGKPERFEETLRSLETTIVAKCILHDHAAIDLKKLSKICKGAEILVCTQKDFVKLPKDVKSFEFPLHVVEAEATVIGGQPAWEDLLTSITLKIEAKELRP